MAKKSSNFSKLARRLAGKGARDPKALAASIGRKLYGQREMTRRSKAGRRKRRR